MGIIDTGCTLKVRQMREALSLFCLLVEALPVGYHALYIVRVR